MRTHQYLILAIVLAAALLLLPACQRPFSGNLVAIDGDTVTLHGDRLRLEGIDAPEMPTSPRSCRRGCPAGDPYESRNVLQAMLDRDDAYCEGRKGNRDFYGRRLVTCFVGRPGPTRVNLNSWMVAHGFAEPYRPSRPAR